MADDIGTNIGYESENIIRMQQLNHGQKFKHFILNAHVKINENSVSKSAQFNKRILLHAQNKKQHQLNEHQVPHETSQTFMNDMPAHMLDHHNNSFDENSQTKHLIPIQLKKQSQVQFYELFSDNLVYTVQKHHGQKYQQFQQKINERRLQQNLIVIPQRIYCSEQISQFLDNGLQQVNKHHRSKFQQFQSKFEQKQQLKSPIVSREQSSNQFTQVAPQQMTHKQTLQMFLLNIPQQISVKHDKHQKNFIKNLNDKILARDRILFVRIQEQESSENIIEIAIMDQEYLKRDPPNLQLINYFISSQISNVRNFMSEASQHITQHNQQKKVQFFEKLFTQSRIVSEQLNNQSKKESLVESLVDQSFEKEQIKFKDIHENKDISEIANMDDRDVNVSLIQKTPFQDQSILEASLILNLDSQRKLTPIKKLHHKTPKHPQAEFKKQLIEDLENSRYLNEKERLKLMLQEELNQISHEIREMRGQKQNSDKNHRKVNGNRDDDDQNAQNLALDLVKRMNQQRRDRRQRQKQQYSKLEGYMRDEIDKLRGQQEVNLLKQSQIVTNQMDNNRKQKIQQRIDDYNKRQMQFVQMQQANQDFIRNLTNQGPQEGQLAHEFDEKIHQIQGQQARRKIRLKEGAIVYLPSINNKQERNIFQHQREIINQNQAQSMPYNLLLKKRRNTQLRAKLPKLIQNYSVSEKLMQVELERAMIKQYKESRKNILLSHQNES